MRYRGPSDVVTRELRRMWEVKVYDGDKDDPKTPLRTETVVAWNEVDAVRKCSGMDVAKQPRPIGFVTWPDEDGGPSYFIENSSGPTDTVAEPSIRSSSDE